MLPTISVLCLCLATASVKANLGQGYNAGQGLGQPSPNQGYNAGQGLGQPYPNQGYNNQGQGGYYGNNNNNQRYGQNPGLGQGGGYNGNGYSGLGQSGQTGNGYSGLGQNQPTNRRYGVEQSTGNYDPSTGLNSAPLNNQGSYGRNRRSPDLGQPMQPQGLGQPIQPQGLGQGGLGQSGFGQPSLGGGQNQGLGQGMQPGLGGSLRVRRYVERAPYSKTCNTYYGKYICYRLYESNAAIPHEFSCWNTYLGKKNCTETENVLYLDRRNVEVDPDEQLNRQFFVDDNGRRTYQESDSTRRDHYRQRDDEFGAVERNLHNQRQNDRRLPGEN